MNDTPTGVNCCSFAVRINKKKTLTCNRANFAGHEHCVFHSARIGEKQISFHTALAEELERWRADDSVSSFDFTGFIFPPTSFRRFARDAFERPVSFRHCRFTGRTLFVNIPFLGEADFSNSQFEGTVRFRGCTFSKKMKLINSRFLLRAQFQKLEFEKVTIDNCEFLKQVDFSGTKFLEMALFLSNKCHGDALFRSCTFLDTASFMHTKFIGRVDLKGATFSNEIIFKASDLAFLKNPPPSGVLLDNAILESAHIWNEQRLADYSFRHAFLLSLSFANKELVNCDFTGAVFKAVFTQGWKPDSKTLLNTKYIYTDYRVTEQQHDGDVTKVYSPVEESRVPAEGVFGAGEHVNFTIADYLKEPLKWSLALSVPPMFRTAVLNYLQFFTDFMTITEGVAVEIRTRQEGGKIRVEFMTDTQEDKELVQQRFSEYRDNTGDDFSSLDIRFNNSQASEIEKELFKIRYEHTITSLRTELGYTQRLLLKEEEKNRLHERYSLLLQQAESYVKDPQRLLLPSESASLQKSQTPIFFLTADLRDYSGATRKDGTLYPTIQTFLFDQKEKIQSDPVCDAVKLEGDSIKVFCRDGVKLIWIAKSLLHDFESLKYEQPTEIKGFRVVLGYGTSYREQRREDVDYSGDPIVETCRVDQPMKKYIEEHNGNPNQIWCTEAFQKELSDKHPNVVFEDLPSTDLDKGYGVGVRLFRVRVE